jgi:hypothetical protein
MDDRQAVSYKITNNEEYFNKKKAKGAENQTQSQGQLHGYISSHTIYIT